ncbi:MAG: glycosyltransferase family 4 protein [Gemmatimonadales bacterium]
MRIGYDTLVENPHNPSSALQYIRRLLETLVRVAPEHEYFAFVSPANRHLFELEAPNLHLVNCFVSNERIPLRILVQQLYYPLLAKRLKLDVIHALSQVPLWAPCATVVKTCGLHHHLFPGEYLRADAQALRAGHPLRLLYRRLVWDASARRADAVIANSQRTAEDISRLMGVPPGRIRTVFEAVDQRFGTVRDVARARQAVTEAFGVRRSYVLYVSNLWFYKNPDGAIRAFADLRRRHGDDVDFVIAGPDDFQRIPALQALAAEQGVADRVHFLGRVGMPLLADLYAASSAVFYPSLAETFGKPVVEGMLSGVPVVAADATCLPEVLGGAGLLVDPGDEPAMADALHRALTDQALRGDLIARGRARASEFSWDATAAGTLAACEAAVLAWRHRTR